MQKVIISVNLSQQNTVCTEWAEQLSKMFGAQRVLHNAVRPVGTEGQLYLIVIGIEPENFFSRFFCKMKGPFFVKNATLPVLTVPLWQKDAATSAPEDLSVPRAAAYAEMPFPAVHKHLSIKPAQ